MPQKTDVAVLYSYPHRIGASRICTTAWHQVVGAAQAGARMILFTGSVARSLPAIVSVHPTLAWGSLRLPYRLLGTLRTCRLHDWLVARRLQDYAGKIDAIHVWPLGALHTLREARRLGIPTLLERPNAHTEFAYEVVRRECENLGLSMPPGHEHEYNERVLRQEEMEYELADYLLCPSDFVAQTFLDRGFPPAKLVRHQYGFDEKQFYPDPQPEADRRGLRVLFAGGCAPRKGLHYALDAWLKSEASTEGVFSIAGTFIPGYREHLSRQLQHPSVRVLGQRSDLPELMRQSDILVLPSIEEGSALVTSEARGSGCVLLVSEAAGAICRHGVNALVHRPRDVAQIAEQLNTLHRDRAMLARLRAASLATTPEIVWGASGRQLAEIYRKASGRFSTFPAPPHA